MLPPSRLLPLTALLGLVLLGSPDRAWAGEEDASAAGCVEPADPDCARKLTDDLAAIQDKVEPAADPARAWLDSMLVDNNKELALQTMVAHCPEAIRREAEEKFYDEGFSEEEKALLAKALEFYLPLKAACPDLPAPKIIQSPVVADCGRIPRGCNEPRCRQVVQDYPGRALTTFDGNQLFIANTDGGSGTDKDDFYAAAVHELVHAFTIRYDPQTCTQYPSWQENPLYDRFRTEFASGFGGLPLRPLTFNDVWMIQERGFAFSVERLVGIRPGDRMKSDTWTENLLRRGAAAESAEPRERPGDEVAQP